MSVRLESVRYQNDRERLLLLREKWPREPDEETERTGTIPLIARRERPTDEFSSFYSTDMTLLLLLLLLYWYQNDIIPSVEMSGRKGSGIRLIPSCLGGDV